MIEGFNFMDEIFYHLDDKSNGLRLYIKDFELSFFAVNEKKKVFIESQRFKPRKFIEQIILKSSGKEGLIIYKGIGFLVKKKINNAIENMRKGVEEPVGEHLTIVKKGNGEIEAVTFINGKYRVEKSEVVKQITNEIKELVEDVKNE